MFLERKYRKKTRKSYLIVRIPFRFEILVRDTIDIFPLQNSVLSVTKSLNLLEMEKSKSKNDLVKTYKICSGKKKLLKTNS